VFFSQRGHEVFRVSSAKRRICAGSCRGTPRPTASMPTRWPVWG
jgi:hypothetical protein